MPRSLDILPQEVFKKHSLTFKEIPVNDYNKKVKDVTAEFSSSDLLRIYEDMAVIREFESALQAIKTQGVYEGLEYNHRGPAHLSIGQEASAVGQAYFLDVDDHIFGSHRSHGEILAKGFSAIHKLPAEELEKIMKNFLAGTTLKVAEKNFQGSIKDLARRFLIYGAYAEIFARITGFNKGLGGSMHAFFVPFGIYPNNAIVGGSGSIAPGAALFKKVNRKKGIVICNIGDAAFSCGPTWEGISFASMDQYRNLWAPAIRGGLPLIFNCVNNHYGMGGQTMGETMGYQFLARIGAGVNPEQMHAERINGYNPLAVLDAIKRKKEICLKGGGPILLDVVTYRVSGHSPSDASSYRTKEEIQAWIAVDPLTTYAQQLVEAGLATSEKIEQIKNAVKKQIKDIFSLAIDLKLSPRMPLSTEEIGDYMFSNQRVEKLDQRQPEVLISKEENPRKKQIKEKSRYAWIDGKLVPKVKQYSLRDGIFEAIFDGFYRDPTLIAFGEENRDWGGAFAVYRGLTEALPYHRLFNAPIAEAAIVGAGIGYALAGGRCIIELMYCDFMGRSGDEIFNQLAKWQAMSAGILKMPVILRVSIGSKYGAQHSQDWTSIIAHIPGLKAVYPVTPFDAKGLMNTALLGTDPVIFFENQNLYDLGEQFATSGVPEGFYEIPIGDPVLRSVGKDITMITLGRPLYLAVEASKILKEKYNLETDLIDLRSINPLHYDKLVQSVKKTGKVVLVTDACERGSFMQTVAANLTTLAFDELDAAPAVVGSRNWITPAAELEEAFFPQVSWILDAIHEKILPLSGYQSSSNQTLGELSRRNSLGI